MTWGSQGGPAFVQNGRGDVLAANALARALYDEVLDGDRAPNLARFRHRVVGDLTLDYEGLDLPADPGQTLITFTALVGSPSAQALGFLASWPATSAGPLRVAGGDHRAREEA